MIGNVLIEIIYPYLVWCAKLSKTIISCKSNQNIT